MDQILRIVEHHRFGGPGFTAFGGDQRVVQAVEAIGLGGRAMILDQHRLDPRVVNLSDRRLGQRVIGIITDEQAKVAVAPASERRAKHVGDHRRFVPRRNEHRDSPGMNGGGKRSGERAGIAGVHRQRTPRAPRKIDQIDRQIVDREQQETGSGEQRQLRRKVGQHESKGHEVAPPG